MIQKALLVSIALMLMCQEGTSQYNMWLGNDLLVSSKVYEFDVYIQASSGTITLTSYQIVLTYNTAIVNHGALSFSYLAGSTQSSLVPNLGVRIKNDAGTSNLMAASNAGADNIDVNGKRLGRFRLTNTVDFATVPANLAWDFLDNIYTIVNVDNGNVTNESNHDNLLVNNPLPITLASFVAKINPSGPGVKLDWATLSEVNNYGFYVQRRSESDSLFTELENSFVPGHGTTVEPQQYTYVDNTLGKVGHYYYRLRQVDLDGTQHFTSASGVSIEVALLSVKEVAPIEFRLHQNYPNPFNPATEIKFSVESTGWAVVKVYNISGQEVATVFDDMAEAGQYYRLRLDGNNLATGVYFYRLQSGKKTDLKKMLLLK